MRYSVFSIFLVLVFAVCLSISSSSFAADGSLDGKTYSVKITEQGKEGEATDDELIFKDGTFFSTDCEQYGFTAAPYTTKSKGDMTGFNSTLTSETEGKAQWNGRIRGEKINGRFVWSKDGQTPITYNFEGSLKK